jgi:hypothetical protein
VNGEVESTDAKSATFSHIWLHIYLPASLTHLGCLYQDVTLMVKATKKDNYFAAIFVPDMNRLDT